MNAKRNWMEGTKWSPKSYWRLFRGSPIVKSRGENFLMGTFEEEYSPPGGPKADDLPQMQSGVEMRTTPTGAKYKKIEYEIIDASKMPKETVEEEYTTQWTFDKHVYRSISLQIAVCSIYCRLQGVSVDLINTIRPSPDPGAAV
ncbi:unnamed protein product [Toxocara canis]|uniref:Bet_v_1 domain-containing protein n=1 Tax=Toxocara canis TaxID=6265 RepID=A0A183UYW2_TOXCA|nr:unnamed protein product [Toxocara canis]